MTKPTLSRIFDDPNHPQYGPVRRLHVMLLQLFGCEYHAAEERYFRDSDYTTHWDKGLSALIRRNGLTEGQAQRKILSRML